ncbi:MAG: hypothetical protein M5R41_03495 [Bacteroidia bacterium]|nr:hypothetical protein [Bacteroidia bacterium]
MPKELYPSSFLCACGYQADFYESTVREMQKASISRQQRLGADDDEHVIVFERGEFTAMWCPKAGKEVPADGDA